MPPTPNPRPKLPDGQRRERVNLMLHPDTVRTLRQSGNASALVDRLVAQWVKPWTAPRN